jgi:hypothetical protein
VCSCPDAARAAGRVNPETEAADASCGPPAVAGVSEEGRMRRVAGSALILAGLTLSICACGDGRAGDEPGPQDAAAEPAAPPPAERPYRAAKPADLVGRWEQMTVAADGELDLTSAWFSAKQYYDFSDDGHVRVLLVEGDAASLLQVSDREADRGYLICCTYYERSMRLPEGVASGLPTPRAGDVTLTYLNPDTRAPMFFRLLRPFRPE